MCRVRVKESRPSVCHWNAGVMSADRNIHRQLFRKRLRPCSCVSKAKTAFVLRLLVMGHWDRNNAELINVAFVWRAGLIQVRTWMRVYSWVDCIWKLPAIVPVGIYYRAAILFITKLWKSCNWIMRLVGDGHMCLSHYCFVLAAGSVHHGLHDIYLICWVHIFQKYSRTGVTYNKASRSRAWWWHLGNYNFSFPQKNETKLW